jgi:hypothetical protein
MAKPYLSSPHAKNHRVTFREGSGEPSPATLAERDRVLAEPPTIGTMLLGEPPRSRSALARRLAMQEGDR